MLSKSKRKRGANKIAGEVESKKDAEEGISASSYFPLVHHLSLMGTAVSLDPQSIVVSSAGAEFTSSVSSWISGDDLGKGEIVDGLTGRRQALNEGGDGLRSRLCEAEMKLTRNDIKGMLDSEDDDNVKTSPSQYLRDKTSLMENHPAFKQWNWKKRGGRG
jgi:hypothetical protein